MQAAREQLDITERQACRYVQANRRMIRYVRIPKDAAVAFSGISGVAIGSFVLLEWALGKWFEQSSREAGVAANVALALAFGLSLRLIHRRVDRFVDTVFFRKRNEDISALRRFAQEAAFITDRDTLLQRTRAQVLEHSEASSVSITILDEPGGNHFVRWPCLSARCRSA